MILREHYKQLYANKFDKLDEIYKFLETYLLKLNQEIKEGFTRHITQRPCTNDKITKMKSHGLDCFNVKLYQTFKGELTLFLKKKEEGTLSNLFYEISITSIPNHINTLETRKL